MKKYLPLIVFFFFLFAISYGQDWKQLDSDKIYTDTVPCKMLITDISLNGSSAAFSINGWVVITQSLLSYKSIYSLQYLSDTKTILSKSYYIWISFYTNPREIRGF